MTDFNFADFKNEVNNALIRHKSILDIITKLEETNSKINRAIIKSVTSCGCIQIQGNKQETPENISFNELKEYMKSHINGDLCEICKEKIEEELGNHLFYITAACNLLDINIEYVLKKENNKLKTLGKYSLL
ncbi:DUF1573 domain-containing protein [Tepidibacter formicigenes]|jgi:predicted house-cleaning noncanonical NTP pyrophosphatase (MazG superfamily)|uniref:DUF1573 domain-containing protein n=1 Tax=Tepidibacter formicigenes DSM 15518 TaxID=1123349 RepID=A0A1M6QLI2_9FIRM|nr:DUF1573 domain-containing protein [Tepidibacter formicigenes]SHK21124.1 hypothetical protein SAMN02744037_01883 [Tepidibacter formicigenes DSM 15518]